MEAGQRLAASRNHAEFIGQVDWDSDGERHFTFTVRVHDSSSPHEKATKTFRLTING